MVETIKKIMVLANEEDPWMERSAKKYVAVLNKERYEVLKLAVRSFEEQLITEENDNLAKEIAKLYNAICGREIFGTWVGDEVGKTPGVVDSRYVAERFIEILKRFEKKLRSNMIISQKNLSETAMSYLVFNNELNATAKDQHLSYRQHDDMQLRSISEFPYGEKIIKRIIKLYKNEVYNFIDEEERKEEIKFLKNYL